MKAATQEVSRANARWQVKRRKLKAQGRWQPFVDAAPVRAHLRAINAAGMPIGAVCERLGLPQTSSLQHVMYGRGSGTNGPGQVVRRETAELVLAYWPSLEDFPDSARIDPTGTRRRVQALMVRGWPRRLMATQIGMSEIYFKKALHKERVTARLARQVADLYNAWWNQDPLDHGVLPRAVHRVQGDAARAGLHGPLAWDDETIDDPKAVPITDAPTPVATEGGNVAARWLLGESVVLGSQDRKELIRHFFEWTELSVEQIAARLEMSPDAVDQAWQRIKKKARLEGAPVPWRRTYALRDKDLDQKDMEEAA